MNKEKAISFRKKILPVALSTAAVGMALSGCKGEEIKPLDATSRNVLSEESANFLWIHIGTPKGYEVVEEANGRIWMPNVDKLPNGTRPEKVAFVTSSLEQNQTRVFNGINARLVEDVNKNGKIDSGDMLVAGGVNGKEVTLKPATQYIAEIGPKNGGFSLEVK